MIMMAFCYDDMQSRSHTLISSHQRQARNSDPKPGGSKFHKMLTWSREPDLEARRRGMEVPLPSEPTMRVSSLALVGVDPVVCGPRVLLAAPPARAIDPAWRMQHTLSDNKILSL